MQLPHSAPASGIGRTFAALGALFRTLALALMGLLAMGVALLAGVVGAIVLVAVALVARRRLRRGDIRFSWPGRMAGRPSPAPGPGRNVRGGGEIIEAEVREIRD
jgi:hypothetical protein